MNKANGALNLISASAGPRYSAIFTALQSNLPSIIDQLGTIQGGTISGDIAEYLLLRNTPNGPRTFSIQLLRGEDGVWRIDGM